MTSLLYYINIACIKGKGCLQLLLCGCRASQAAEINVAAAAARDAPEATDRCMPYLLFPVPDLSLAVLQQRLPVLIKVHILNAICATNAGH